MTTQHYSSRPWNLICAEELACVPPPPSTRATGRGQAKSAPGCCAARRCWLPGAAAPYPLNQHVTGDGSAQGLGQSSAAHRAGPHAATCGCCANGTTAERSMTGQRRRGSRGCSSTCFASSQRPASWCDRQTPAARAQGCTAFASVPEHRRHPCSIMLVRSSRRPNGLKCVPV